MGAGAGFRGEAAYAPKPETLYYIDFDYFRKAGSIPKLVQFITYRNKSYHYLLIQKSNKLTRARDVG